MYDQRLTMRDNLVHSSIARIYSSFPLSTGASGCQTTMELNLPVGLSCISGEIVDVGANGATSSTSISSSTRDIIAYMSSSASSLTMTLRVRGTPRDFFTAFEALESTRLRFDDPSGTISSAGPVVDCKRYPWKPSGSGMSKP